jgi:hypothetical protein
MNKVEQIYCTHCTYATSALDRDMASAGDLVLGYSARAGSLQGEALGEAYRQLEPALTYDLPPDTPNADRIRLAPLEAPRSLVFYPNLGTREVIGQICYRSRAADGRTGSYFAHLLFRDAGRGADRWSARNALQLYGATGWVVEDRANIDMQLPALAAAGDLLGGAAPAVSDAALSGFLTATAGGPVVDAGGLIPGHWRARPAQERCDLLRGTLHGLLGAARDGEANVLLVLEPGLAALLFYGLFRLLPPGSFAESLSVSTYTPVGGRRLTHLAATIFQTPQGNELPDPAYAPEGGFALNAFSGRRTPLPQTAGTYAPLLVDALLEKGWPAVDAMLARLHKVGAARSEHLEEAARAHRGAFVLLDPQAPQADTPTVAAPAAYNYLSQQVRDELCMPQAQHRPGWVGSPAHVRAIHLLAADSVSLVSGRFHWLLTGLGPVQVAQLVSSRDIPREVKIGLLVEAARAHRQLPAGTDFLWADAPPGGLTLFDVLNQLEPQVIRDLAVKVAVEHLPHLMAALAQASAGHDGKTRLLSKILVEFVTKAGETRLCRLLNDPNGAALFRFYPRKDPTLRKKLLRLMAGLPEDPSALADRLAALTSAGQMQLLTPGEGERVAAWQSAVEEIRQIGQLTEPAAGTSRRQEKDLEAACRRLAGAFYKALPVDGDADRDGQLRLNCLQRLAEHLHGCGDALSPRLWDTIQLFFAGYGWKNLPRRRRLGGRQWRAVATWGIVLVAAGALCFIVVGLAVVAYRASNKTSSTEVETSQTNNDPSAPAIVTPAAPQNPGPPPRMTNPAPPPTAVARPPTPPAPPAQPQQPPPPVLAPPGVANAGTVAQELDDWERKLNEAKTKWTQVETDETNTKSRIQESLTQTEKTIQSAMLWTEEQHSEKEFQDVARVFVDLSNKTVSGVKVRGYAADGGKPVFEDDRMRLIPKPGGGGEKLVYWCSMREQHGKRIRRMQFELVLDGPAIPLIRETPDGLKGGREYTLGFKKDVESEDHVGKWLDFHKKLQDSQGRLTEAKQQWDKAQGEWKARKDSLVETVKNGQDAIKGRIRAWAASEGKTLRLKVESHKGTQPFATPRVEFSPRQLLGVAPLPEGLEIKCKLGISGQPFTLSGTNPEQELEGAITSIQVSLEWQIGQDRVVSDRTQVFSPNRVFLQGHRYRLQFESDSKQEEKLKVLAEELRAWSKWQGLRTRLDELGKEAAQP